MSLWLRSTVCRHCRTSFACPTQRTISTSLPKNQDNTNGGINEESGTELQSTRPRTSLKYSPRFASKELESLAQSARAEASTRPGSGVSMTEPYHLNIYAHRHNIHITFTEPSRNPILSYSAGNIGLRKSQRGSFDAAYQLSTYTMRKITEKQWRTGGKGATFNKMMTINEQEFKDRGIELVFRGYGSGREGFQKALLGNEGKTLKTLVKKVTDGTRLKFGGTRSHRVRRLG